MDTDPLTTWGAAARRYPDRAEWLADRSAGLGASQVAAVLRRSPHAGPWDVWCALHAPEALPTPDAAKATDYRRGHAFEAAALTLYEMEAGATVDRCDPAQVWRPDAPWMRCSPDGVVLRDAEAIGLVEAKTSRDAADARGWPQHVAGLDIGVPRLDWLIQCVWQAIVTGAPWVDLVVVGPFWDVAVCRVEPDASAAGALREAVGAWWEQYGDGLACPPSDGSDACRAYWRSRPRGPGVVEVQGDVLARWAEARAELERAKAVEAAAKGAVAEAIAAHKGITDGRWTAKYDARGAMRLSGG